jgi:hypothetical protein
MKRDRGLVRTAGLRRDGAGGWRPPGRPPPSRHGQTPCPSHCHRGPGDLAPREFALPGLPEAPPPGRMESMEKRRTTKPARRNRALAPPGRCARDVEHGARPAAIRSLTEKARAATPRRCGRVLGARSRRAPMADHGRARSADGTGAGERRVATGQRPSRARAEDPSRTLYLARPLRRRRPGGGGRKGGDGVAQGRAAFRLCAFRAMNRSASMGLPTIGRSAVPGACEDTSPLSLRPRPGGRRASVRSRATGGATGAQAGRDNREGELTRKLRRARGERLAPVRAIRSEADRGPSGGRSLAPNAIGNPAAAGGPSSLCEAACRESDSRVIIHRRGTERRRRQA